MSSIFSQIVNGDMPCFKVAESDQFMAFLDINPLKEGHTLVIPKKEVDYIFDLDDSALSGLMLFARRVAVAVEKVVSCKRIGVVVMGLEVPHAHIHLIPMDREEDLSFSRSRAKVAPQRFGELAALISEQFDSLD